MQKSPLITNTKSLSIKYLPVLNWQRLCHVLLLTIYSATHIVVLTSNSPPLHDDPSLSFKEHHHDMTGAACSYATAI